MIMLPAVELSFYDSLRLPANGLAVPCHGSSRDSVVISEFIWQRVISNGFLEAATCPNKLENL